jgi:hypothetical protein
MWASETNPDERRCRFRGKLVTAMRHLVKLLLVRATDNKTLGTKEIYGYWQSELDTRNPYQL